jgi:hypothetical protein
MYLRDIGRMVEMGGVLYPFMGYNGSGSLCFCAPTSREQPQDLPFSLAHIALTLSAALMIVELLLDRPPEVRLQFQALQRLNVDAAGR